MRSIAIVLIAVVVVCAMTNAQLLRQMLRGAASDYAMDGIGNCFPIGNCLLCPPGRPCNPSAACARDCASLTMKTQGCNIIHHCVCCH